MQIQSTIATLTADVRQLISFIIQAVVTNKLDFICLSGYDNAAEFDRTSELIRDLNAKGYNVIEGEGKYKGTAERSLLLPLANFDAETVKDIIALAREYNQESILVKNSAGAFFVYTNEQTPECIGHRILTGDDARQQDFYSEFGGIAFTIV